MTEGATPTSPTARARGLLILSVLAFVLWTLALIAMYCKTVYPHRHPTRTFQQQPTPSTVK
jgi:hypothetical protein